MDHKVEIIFWKCLAVFLCILFLTSTAILARGVQQAQHMGIQNAEMILKQGEQIMAILNNELFILEKISK